MTTMRLASLFLAFLLLPSLPAVAQPSSTPTIQVEHVECIPPGHPDGRRGARESGDDDPDDSKNGRDRRDNGVVNGTIAEQPGGTEARLFFRWNLDEDFYWVKMTPDGAGGRHWAVLPEAADKNEIVEYYGAVVDPDNRILARTEAFESPVEDDCEIELTDRQHGTAKNLTVGETTFEQQGMEVDGFICDGVVTRIDPNGVLRSDPLCRACIIAWWEQPGIVAPAIAGAVAGGVLISQEGEPEASPSDP